MIRIKRLLRAVAYFLMCGAVNMVLSPLYHYVLGVPYVEAITISILVPVVLGLVVGILDSWEYGLPPPFTPQAIDDGVDRLLGFTYLYNSSSWGLYTRVDD